MKVKILRSAVEDLHSGRSFYEKQGEGLGDYFLDTLFSEIDSLALYAGIHPTFHNHFRLLSRRFPYAVYYKVNGDVALVHRVLDLRRDPSKTRSALKLDSLARR